MATSNQPLEIRRKEKTAISDYQPSQAHQILAAINNQLTTINLSTTTNIVKLTKF